MAAALGLIPHLFTAKQFLLVRSISFSVFLIGLYRGG